MINIVMLAKNRDALTQQAISSLQSHTDVKWNLVVVDDASTRPVAEWIRPRRTDQISILRNETSKGITGQVRNLGIYWSQKYWGRGDYLLLVDNDIYFLPQWASKMIQAIAANPGVKVLGGYRHPYHGVNKRIGVSLSTNIEITDAVAGYLQMMTWQTWDEYGPLDAHAVGVSQSEDFKFCRDCVSDGGLVGYITPPVISVCSLTDTFGKKVAGAEQFHRIGGVLYV